MTEPSAPTPALLAGTVLALDVVAEHVVLLDEHGVIVHANLAWQRFGLDNGDVRTNWVGVDYVAASSEPCVAAGIADPVTDGVRDVLAGRRREFRCEYDCHAPDELRWFRLTAVGADLPGIAAVVTHVDITSERGAERALEHHATHDRTTGTANRASLEQQLSQMITEGLDASVVKVALVDRDQHGQLLPNDTLRQAAQLLRELFPAPATVGRWDDATLLVAQAGPDAATLESTTTIVEDALAALPGSVAADVTARLVSTLPEVDAPPSQDRVG